MEKDKKRRIYGYGLSIILGTILLLGISYAWLTITLSGTKTNVLKSGTLSLFLDETMGEGINVTSGMPMYDEEGLVQTPYRFSLVNNGTVSSEYTIYLDDEPLETGETRAEDASFKYSLTKNQVLGKAVLLPTLGSNPNRIVDSDVIMAKETIEYELRLWVDENVTSSKSGQVFRGKLRVEANQTKPSEAQLMILENNPVQETKAKMFNYTNLGTTKGVETPDPNFVTNGVYTAEDDDGVSYYFRGKVNNLVKFGEYKQDYYVYRYDSYDFTSLEACKYFNSSCSESNKVLKYPAGTPMYWKIIRINGDSTIRMIYSGTTPDATGNETGVGVSRYSENFSNPKHAGYTYDNGTDSKVKIEVDNWYNNALAGSKYDSQIVTGRFCSDTSNYQEASKNNGSNTYHNWASEQRLDHLQNDQKVETVMPTLKCPATTESYGGSYRLKAGLITADEIVLAGGEADGVPNTNYYLYSGSLYWSMTPSAFYGVSAEVWLLDRFGYLDYYHVLGSPDGSVRPVINLSTKTKFAPGGTGTIENPYVVLDPEI